MASTAQALSFTSLASTDPAPEPTGVLAFTGNDPRDVWVRIQNRAPEFSQDGETWPFSSMKWTCAASNSDPKDRYALIITYHLVIGPGETQLPELRPSDDKHPLFFSPIIGPPVSGGTPTQIGAVPWVSEQTTFTFKVSDADPGFPVTPGNSALV